MKKLAPKRKNYSSWYQFFKKVECGKIIINKILFLDAQFKVVL